MIKEEFREIFAKNPAPTPLPYRTGKLRDAKAYNLEKIAKSAKAKCCDDAVLGTLPRGDGAGVYCVERKLTARKDTDAKSHAWTQLQGGAKALEARLDIKGRFKFFPVVFYENEKTPLYVIVSMPPQHSVKFNGREQCVYCIRKGKTLPLGRRGQSGAS